MAASIAYFRRRFSVGNVVSRIGILRSVTVRDGRAAPLDEATWLTSSNAEAVMPQQTRLAQGGLG
ncbi:MAG: hypothetical protein CMJ75_18325 [Planctomycetaceae bacterium]|nr:hypothetical protein [Planctomycetaceae bacterium]